MLSMCSRNNSPEHPNPEITQLAKTINSKRQNDLFFSFFKANLDIKLVKKKATGQIKWNLMSMVIQYSVLYPFC